MSRSRWKHLSLAAGSVVLTLLAVEQGYRAYLFGWDSFSVAKIDSLHGFGVSGLLQASEVEDLAYELRPNLDTLFQRVEFRTNSRGEHDREYPLEKPDGSFRVLVVGDSFSMPSGVRLEDAWHSLLEGQWSERTSRPVEVVNLAVAGYNLRQYSGVIARKAMALPA